MCGISSGKLGGNEVDFYIGYFGGSIKIGNRPYYLSSTHHDRLMSRERKYTILSREEIIKIFNGYSVKELSELIVDLVENGEEG